MRKIKSGLDRLISCKETQGKLRPPFGLLCHAASIDSTYLHAADLLIDLFGDNLTTLFSPQHGLVADVQDNMVESPHFFHQHYQRQVYSLYSETREPTADMLEGLGSVIIDLQDVGTRVYTYLYTMTNTMEACGKAGVSVVVLDRPNPIGGQKCEGNILETAYTSFVGMHPIPVVHGLTMGELALMAKKFWGIECDLHIISMEGWKRSMSFEDTGLPWVQPSPNLSGPESCWTFPATVFLEGTNASEGRGTTRALEQIGLPGIDPHKLRDNLYSALPPEVAESFVARPVSFVPTFQKHQGQACSGVFLHVVDRSTWRPWLVGQVLCSVLFHNTRSDTVKFAWKPPPYEYETEKLPVDVINGSSFPRQWVERGGLVQELLEWEKQSGLDEFRQQRDSVLLYT